MVRVMSVMGERTEANGEGIFKRQTEVQSQVLRVQLSNRCRDRYKR
jgi:hypothetical protein